MRPEDREAYHRRYEELKYQGKSFYPYSILKDIVVSLAVFLVMMGMLVWQGIPMEARADPTNASYIPRPEWYFMFLFEMLKFFPGRLEPIGVAVIPGILVTLLFLLPFLDRSPFRHPRQRPMVVAITTVAVLGIALLTYSAYMSTPAGPPAAGPLTAEQQAGRALYQQMGCSGCHPIAGAGGTTAPDLVGIGSRRDAAFIRQYVKEPKVIDAGSIMPAFGPRMSDKELDEMTQYLLTLK